jgi:hypothetical protein
MFLLMPYFKNALNVFNKHGKCGIMQILEEYHVAVVDMVPHHQHNVVREVEMIIVKCLAFN